MTDNGERGGVITTPTEPGLAVGGLMMMRLPQPWAFFVVNGLQYVISVPDRFELTGKLVIYADPVPSAVDTAALMLLHRFYMPGSDLGGGSKLPYLATNAVVGIVRVALNRPTELVKLPSKVQRSLVDVTPGRWAWLLSSSIPTCPALPCPWPEEYGSRGLAPVPDHVLDLMAKQFADLYEATRRRAARATADRPGGDSERGLVTGSLFDQCSHDHNVGLCPRHPERSCQCGQEGAHRVHVCRWCHKPFGDEFDLDESKRRKEAGIEEATKNPNAELERARELAEERARSTDMRSDCDRVAAALAEEGIHLGKWAGQIFRDRSKWRWTGEWIKSARKDNHARDLRVWELIS